MTWVLNGRIRAYDPVSDTATVELEGIGIIDAWLDGLKLHASLNRSYAVHGATATLQAPDPHRLCEAIITSIGDGVSTPIAQGSSGVQQTLTGRNNIETDSLGDGSTTVTFATPFTAVPAFFATADDRLAISISDLSATGFTAAIAGGTHSIYLYFSWQAAGPR